MLYFNHIKFIQRISKNLMCYTLIALSETFSLQNFIVKGIIIWAELDTFFCITTLLPDQYSKTSGLVSLSITISAPLFSVNEHMISGGPIGKALLSRSSDWPKSEHELFKRPIRCRMKKLASFPIPLNLENWKNETPVLIGSNLFPTRW